MPEADVVREAYTEFLCTLRGIVDHRRVRIESAEERELAEQLTGPVFGALMGRAAVGAVVGAFRLNGRVEDGRDEARPNDEVVLNALLAEMQFFNARYGNFRGEEGGRDGEADEGAGDGHVVKGSLEKILGATLPDWIKRLLEVLNEILSLIRPI